MTYETRSVRVHTLTTGTSGFCPIVSFMMIWSPVFLKSFCWQSSIESPKFKIKSQSQRLKRISAGRLLVFVLDALSPLTRFPLSYLPSRGRSSVLKTWVNNLNKSSLPVKCNIWHQCSVTTSSKLDCVFISMWTSLALPLSTHQRVPGHLWGCHRLWGEGFFLCKVQVCWWIHWLERLGERGRTLELRFWNESAAPPHPPGYHRDSPRQPPAQARTAGVRTCWRKVVFNPMYTVLLPVENLKKKKSKMSLKFLPYCAADRSRTHPGRLGCSWSSLQTPQDSGQLRQTEQTHDTELKRCASQEWNKLWRFIIHPSLHSSLLILKSLNRFKCRWSPSKKWFPCFWPEDANQLVISQFYICKSHAEFTG